MGMADLVLPAIRLLDPETAHRLTVCLLRMTGPFQGRPDHHRALATRTFGLSFPSPVGLAAGFDKDAEAVAGAFKLGFGFVEVGTITPRPQYGNPKPRLFRLPEDKAVINRMGFNNGGMQAAALRLQALRDGAPLPGMLGVNIGKNKTSEDAAGDYGACARALAEFADYLTINVSSPNTPGLRALQSPESVHALVTAVRNGAVEAAGKAPPILIKIAPDLEESDLMPILDAAMDADVAGLIIANTTVARPRTLRSAYHSETGGLSGAPLRDQATALLSRCYQQTKGAVPLIGVGGIASAEDAYARIRAGARLVQLYTAMVFAGPGLIRKINDGLVKKLHADGFETIEQAIGADHR